MKNQRSNTMNDIKYSDYDLEILEIEEMGELQKYELKGSEK